MSVHLIDPLHDRRWGDLIQRHPEASVFHSPAWLSALDRTYGYQPIVFTTSPPGGELRSGLAACQVRTWLGKRLVSLPFSDHCEPLVDRHSDLDEIRFFLGRAVDAGKWKFVELRPRRSSPEAFGAAPFHAAERLSLHRLDLSPSLQETFRHLHPSCVRRAFRRAEREGLTYEAGRSEQLLAGFYRLLRLTRRRHGLPPQPLAWFRNLIACFGERLTIRLASKDGRPVAGMLTLAFMRRLTYKYGCSDAREHRLGGMSFLFWHTIQESKDQGFDELDLGRSDFGQAGLVAFKDRLGAHRSVMTYYRYPASAVRPSVESWPVQAARRLFTHLPDPALTVAGRVLYRHFG